jgi:hypothetical protein
MAAYLILLAKDSGKVPSFGGSIGTGYWIAIFLVPPVIWLLWYSRAYVHYDRFVLLNTLLHMDKRLAFDAHLVLVKAVSFILNTGAVFLCPLAVFWGLGGRFRTRIALLVFLLSLAPTYLLWPDVFWGHRILFALFFSSGFLICSEFVLLLGREYSAGRRLLVLWYLGILVACLALFYAGSVRYVLLALPAVILVWVTRLESTVQEGYFRRNLLWAGLWITLAYSIPIAYADYRFAETYRRYTAELHQEYAASGHRVWFTGEWGFRYYLEKSGARPIGRTQQGPQEGDIIIKPFVASPWVTLYDGAPYTVLLEQRIVQESWPIRILDFSSKAGFYSTGWGLLPFSWTSGENWEWFNVFRVERPFEGPIPEPERHW